MSAPTVVTLLGASGAVGGELLSLLSAHAVPFQLDAFGGPAHAEDDDTEIPIHPLTEDETLDGDITVFATPGALTAALAARVEGGAILDLTGRLVDAPLVVGPADAGSPRPVRLAEPAAVAIAMVANALSDLGLTALSATVMDPASARGRAALDELRDQSVALLSFRTPPTEALGQRLAFDLLAGQPLDDTGRLREQLASLLTGLVVPSVARVLAPVFIGTGIALHLTFEGAVTADALAGRLDATPELAWQPTAPDIASAVSAGTLLVGPMAQTTAAGAHHTLWLAVDNLRHISARAAAVLAHWTGAR